MKSFLKIVLAALAGSSVAQAADDPTYTNWIYQYQMPSNVTWNAKDSVAPTGSQQSTLAINPGGARFDLSTIKAVGSTLTEYVLDSSYVGTYVPQGAVVIDCGDTYGKDLSYAGTPPRNLPAMIRRTRADQPFTAYVTVSGLLSGTDDPEASKSVKLLRHVQSYGAGGTGVNLNRTQATLLSQASVTTNGLQILSYTLNSVPGSDRSKVRGEERFSVFSLADYQAPESQLASQFIQIWPVANGTISGLTMNQLIRYSMPQVTLTLTDLYPDSKTYAQVYRGNVGSNVAGKVVPGSHKVIYDSVPNSITLSLMNYDDIFDGDGRWTMEVLTQTPFGIDRLAYVSFDLDRTIQVNGSFTTIE